MQPLAPMDFLFTGASLPAPSDITALFFCLPLAAHVRQLLLRPLQCLREFLPEALLSALELCFGADLSGLPEILDSCRRALNSSVCFCCVWRNRLREFNSLIHIFLCLLKFHPNGSSRQEAHNEESRWVDLFVESHLLPSGVQHIIPPECRTGRSSPPAAHSATVNAYE